MAEMTEWSKRLNNPKIYVDLMQQISKRGDVYSDFEEQAFADPERQRYMIDRIREAIGPWAHDAEEKRLMTTMMIHLIGNAESATGDPVPQEYLYGAMEMLAMLIGSRYFLHADIIKDDQVSPKMWDLLGPEED